MPAAPGTGTIAQRLVSDAFSALAPGEVAGLEIIEGPDLGKRLALAETAQPYRIGRAPECALVLSDPDVSREHITILRDWEGVMVSDLGSKNGVTVDGVRVQGQRHVSDGAILVIGCTHLRVDDPEQRYQDEVEAMRRQAIAPAPAIESETPVATQQAVEVKPTVPIPPDPAGVVAPGTPPAVWLAVGVLLTLLALGAWLALGS